MKLLTKLSLITVTVGLLGGGGYVASPWGMDLLELKKDPETIAQRFWQAAISETPKEAHKYIVTEQNIELGIIGDHPNDRVVFGKATQQDYAWFVDTTLIMFRDGEQLVVPVQTVVVPEGDLWRIDYWSTKNSIFDASLNNVLDWYINTVSGASRLFDDIGGADEKTMKSQVSALDKRLTEEFARVKTQLVEQYTNALQIEIDKAKYNQQIAEEKAIVGG